MSKQQASATNTGPITEDHLDDRSMGVGYFLADLAWLLLMLKVATILALQLPGYFPDFATDAVLLCAVIFAVRSSLVSYRVYRTTKTEGKPEPYGTFHVFLARLIVGSLAPVVFIWLMIPLRMTPLLPAGDPFSFRIFAVQCWALLPCLTYCLAVPLVALFDFATAKASPDFQLLRLVALRLPPGILIFSLPYLFAMGRRHDSPTVFQNTSDPWWIGLVLWLATGFLASVMLVGGYKGAKTIYSSSPTRTIKTETK